MGEATISIARENGLQHFQVEFDEFTTVMDALEIIRGSRDPSLLYRHSCHHGSCGTCGVIANGMRVLGCVTRIAELDHPVRLHPLSPFPVIRDLAIDASPLYSGFPEDATMLRTSAGSGGEPPEEVGAFTRFENCIECGLCESSCPVLIGPPVTSGEATQGAPAGRRFRGPAALAAYSREIENRPDREDELLSEIDCRDGVWGCDRALQCSLVCPVGVYPAKHIAVLQRKIGARKAPV